MSEWRRPGEVGPDIQPCSGIGSSSALFVLTSDETLDRIHEEFQGQHAESISTNLPHEEEARLREVFAD